MFSPKTMEASSSTISIVILFLPCIYAHVLCTNILNIEVLYSITFGQNLTTKLIIT